MAEVFIKIPAFIYSITLVHNSSNRSANQKYNII